MTESDFPTLDEIEIPGIEEYPVTESVLLHGPPGTGKTTTAAGRVGRLIRDHGYSIADVTWGTYRRALAEDTLDRLNEWGVVSDVELDEPSKGSTRYISTIHAIANRIAGDIPDPIDPWMPATFCKQAGIRYKTNKPWDRSPGKELFRCFEWLAENCYDPTDPSDLRRYPHLDTLRQQFPGDVGDAWEAWETYKQSKDRIDYHEQLETVLDQGDTPGTAILVIDEYHDATPLLACVAERWMRDAKIVIVAGDPHQVVNSYQGASPMYFDRLEDRYPKVLLDKSWRVGAVNWELSSNLLARAHDPPAIETTGTGSIRVYPRSGTFEMADAGWRTPPKTNKGSPVALASEYDDVMFLTRTRRQADGVGAALEKEGILYRSQEELGGWNIERGETRLALFNALTKIRGLSPGDFDAPGWDQGLAKWESGTKSPTDIYLAAAEAAALLEHTNTRETHAVSRSAMNDVVAKISDIGIAQPLTTINEYVEPEFWATYTHGAASERDLKKHGSERERWALRTALQTHDRPIDPSEIDVSVMTIHASKGQEAEDVVLYDGITSRIERTMRTSDAARKNEWRTWYVATTRASERLHIIRDAFRWTSQMLPTDLHDIGNLSRIDREQEVDDD